MVLGIDQEQRRIIHYLYLKLNYTLLIITKAEKNVRALI